MKSRALILALTALLSVGVLTGCDDHSADVEKLNSELTQYKDMNDSLRAQVTALQAENAALKQELADKTTNGSTPSTTPDSSIIEQYKAQLAHLQGQLETRKAQHQDTINALIAIRSSIKKGEAGILGTDPAAKTIITKIDAILQQHGGDAEIIK